MYKEASLFACLKKIEKNPPDIREANSWPRDQRKSGTLAGAELFAFC